MATQELATLTEDTAEFALPFSNGTLIQPPGTQMVYVIVYGQTCFIPNTTVAGNVFGGNWSNLVQQCSLAQFDQYPVGPALSDDACLVKSPSGQICVYSWGQYFWIVNSTVLSTYNFNGSPVSVNSTLFAAMPQSLDITLGPTGLIPDGSLIQVGGAGTVYLVIYGQTCGIPNPTVAANLFGPNWGSLIDQVTQQHFDAYPAGPALNDNACLLSASGTLYLYTWNQYFEIVSSTIQSQYNFNGTAVPVTTTFLKALSQGFDITA